MITLRWFITGMLAIILWSVNLMAQWTQQASPLPSGITAHSFLAVNENIAWGIGFIDTAPSRNVIRTVDGGKTWRLTTITTAPNLLLVDVFARDSSTAWVSVFDFNLSREGGVFKTTDGGNSWIRQSNLYDRSGTAPLYVYFFDEKDGLVVGQSPDGYFEIHTTVDGGNAWTRVAKDSIPAFVTGELGVISSYATQGNSFWFGTFPGRVFRTTNRGKSWAASNPGLGPTTVVFLAFQDELNGMATRYFPDRNRFAKTTDGGKTWTILNSLQGITGPVKFIPGTTASYILGARGYLGEVPGSAYTLDGGISWKVIDNLSHTVPAFVSPQIGWIGGDNFIYKWAGAPLAIKEMLSALPEQYALSQNFPNPFNPSTTIRYSLAQAERVSLKVFNLAGQEIVTLFEGKQSAGEHHVQWRAEGAPSGVYFYRLQAGEKVETRKMILMQ